MKFGNHQAFWLLWVVPAMVLFLVVRARAYRRAVDQFAAAPLDHRLMRAVNHAARTWKSVLVVAAIGLGLVALAHPRWGFEWREVSHRGVDVFVLLDVSKSMLAEDIKPNRLERAKLAALDLMQQAQADRLAHVVGTRRDLDLRLLGRHGAPDQQ